MKKRDSNFELLRIVTMLMIISWHYIVHNTFLNSLEPKSLIYIIMTIVKFGCAIAVNCYVLISGYYLCNSEFKLNKIIKLWIIIFIYSFGIQLVFYITGKDKSISELVYSMFPIITSRYWFTTVYFAMYLLVPFLNILIKSINKRKLRLLIVILILLASIIRTVYPKNIQFASSLLLFILLYFIAAYSRLYYQERINRRVYLYFYYIIPILLLLIQFGLIKYQIHYPILTQYLNNLIYYNTLPILIESICLFLYFKNMKIKNEKINKGICYIASLIFPTYLIHDNKLIRPWLWNKLKVDEYAITKFAILHFLLCVIIVFVICGIIEIFRTTVVRVFLRKINVVINNKVKNIQEKIESYLKEEK